MSDYITRSYIFTRKMRSHVKKKMRKQIKVTRDRGMSRRMLFKETEESVAVDKEEEEKEEEITCCL